MTQAKEPLFEKSGAKTFVNQGQSHPTRPFLTTNPPKQKPSKY
jgi:hypothetical protein